MTPGKQSNIKLIKPIPNKTTESCDQKTDLYASYQFSNQKSLKSELREWIYDVFRPTHFLTVQLPDNKKSTNLDNSKENLRNIMKAFEKSLMNNWNRHHLPFIAFAELGLSDEWHFHILLNQSKYTDEQLQNAILKTIIREKLPSYCLELDTIHNHINKVEDYCIKEIKVKEYNKFDSDRIIFSHDLFSL